MEQKLPILARGALFFVGVLALFTILYIAQGIIVPLIFATIIAIVLHPLVNFFVRIGVNRILAIVLVLFLTFLAIAAFCVLLYTQIMQFGESWPKLVDNITGTINETVTWAAGYLDIKPKIIYAWINETKTELLSSSTSAIGKTIVTVGGGLLVMVLVPVYVFIILFYQPLLREFINMLFSAENHNKVGEIVGQTKTLIQRYLVGLVIEAAIVAAMYMAALFALGIEYALLLAIIGALLNMIPYVGGLVGVALPMMVALATKPSAWVAIYILIIYYIIQLIDNNYIVPKIVASKVKINALFSIIAVIAGNALWGVSGMFLSIPLIAIVKLIFDHIEGLKPWGFLLGDTMPPLLKIKTKKNKLIRTL